MGIARMYYVGENAGPLIDSGTDHPVWKMAGRPSRRRLTAAVLIHIVWTISYNLWNALCHKTDEDKRMQHLLMGQHAPAHSTLR